MIGWFLRRAPELGRRGERLASRYLRRAGYTILGRNVRLGRYEIDIIAQQGDTIAFVEVKARRPSPIAEPEDNVTFTKRRHLRRAAGQYMDQRNNPREYYRFDIISVVIPETGKARVTHFPNAFPDE